ncbi:MAG: DUF2157 domain-containing protein [Ignavibacteriales bacterium]
MKITITKEELKNVAAEGIISDEQADNLWTHFYEINQGKAGFTGSNVLYYFGALIVISAMTWFATEAFAKYNALGLFAVGILYFSGLFFFGNNLYYKKRTEIPGGLLLTSAVFMVPLIIYSIQEYFKIWGYEAPGNYKDFYILVRSGWFMLETVTIIVSILFLMKYDFTFLTFPLAFSLWFLSIDITPIIFTHDQLSWQQREIVSLYFGLFILLFAYLIDRKTQKDYAFWLYLFGMICFWGGLSLMDSNSELNKFLYLCVNLFLMVISVLFNRRVFIVFGVLGVYGYLYHLSSIVFRDSLMFPFILSLIGIFIIWLGIKYNKNKESIDGFINSKIPDKIFKLLPPGRI